MSPMWQHPHEAITTRQSCSLWLHVSKDMGKYGEKSTRTIAHVQIQEMLFSCGSCWAARKTAKADNARERVLLNIVEQVCNALHDFYITSLLPILMVFSCLFQQNYFHKSSIAMVKKQPKLDLVLPLIFSLFRQVYFCLSCFESTGVLAKKYWGADEGVLRCWRTDTLVVQKRN